MLLITSTRVELQALRLGQLWRDLGWLACRPVHQAAGDHAQDDAMVEGVMVPMAWKQRDDQDRFQSNSLIDNSAATLPEELRFWADGSHGNMEALSAGARIRGTAGRYAEGFRKTLHGPMAQGMIPLFLLTPSHSFPSQLLAAPCAGIHP